MKKRICFLSAAVAAVLILLVCAGCSNFNSKAELLPEILRNQTFIYDELENDVDSGNTLYTIRFTDSGYYLYKDNGTGVISDGTVTV
ncbi:MAG: hypothetical protein K2G22_04850, partial [Eubacterium sp.]|nr:hypothetical protein [Eubacterium sp.]